MRLGSVLELIAVLSVGMATATWLVQDPRMAAVYSQGTWRLWLKDLADGFVGGVVLSGFVGVWVERARGRSPLPWGLGRWAWSVIGLYILLHYGLTYAYRNDNDPVGMVRGLPADIRVQLIFWLRNAPAYVIVAVGITYFGATTRPMPRPDSRELAGRILSAVIVISGMINLWGAGIGF